MKFKVGDRVRFVKGHSYHAGETGVIGSIDTDGYYIFTFDKKPGGPAWRQGEEHNDPHPGKYGWYTRHDGLELIPETPSATNSIADELQLKPQARKILAHLKKGRTISPVEAQTVYGVFRLAASIHDLRRAGYPIKTKHSSDTMGHKYARYSMEAAH